jgi:hypothetical protein
MPDIGGIRLPYFEIPSCLFRPVPAGESSFHDMHHLRRRRVDLCENRPHRMARAPAPVAAPARLSVLQSYRCRQQCSPDASRAFIADVGKSPINRVAAGPERSANYRDAHRSEQSLLA